MYPVWSFFSYTRVSCIITIYVFSDVLILRSLAWVQNCWFWECLVSPTQHQLIFCSEYRRAESELKCCFFLFLAFLCWSFFPLSFLSYLRGLSSGEFESGSVCNTSWDSFRETPWIWNEEYNECFNYVQFQPPIVCWLCFMYHILTATIVERPISLLHPDVSHQIFLSPAGSLHFPISLPFQAAKCGPKPMSWPHLLMSKQRQKLECLLC